MLEQSEKKSTTVFLERFNGRFVSALKWSQLDQLWHTLKQGQELWYVYQIGETRPEQTSSPDELALFIEEVDLLLRQEHDESYCGIVYADDLSSPTMIKIYDPGNLGASCGSSGRKILPRWVLSVTPPLELEDESIVPANRRRWWERLLDNL